MEYVTYASVFGPIVTIGLAVWCNRLDTQLREAKNRHDALHNTFVSVVKGEKQATLVRQDGCTLIAIHKKEK